MLALFSSATVITVEGTSTLPSSGMNHSRVEPSSSRFFSTDSSRIIMTLHSPVSSFARAEEPDSIITSCLPRASKYSSPYLSTRPTMVAMAVPEVKGLDMEIMPAAEVS